MKAAPAVTQPSLFDREVMRVPTREIRGMVRGSDRIEAQHAAIDVLPITKKLQADVYAVLKAQGPMTDRELEELPQFARYGPSSVRKRRSELLQAGRVQAVGRKDKLTLWSVTP